MNWERISKMVAPYIRDNTLTYRDFEQIFIMLSKKERYNVADMLSENGIMLKDYYPENTPQTDEEDFKILYENSLFTDSPENKPKPVRYYKDIKQSNENLCRLIREGNAQAKQDLIVKNQRLVQEYVAKYSHAFKRNDSEDLEQCGYLGLLRAAELYDPSEETKFSTYAVFWIKQAILREIFNNASAVRIPVHMVEKILKLNALEQQFDFSGRDSVERVPFIAEQMEIPEAKVREIMLIRKLYLNIHSLNQPVGEDSDTEIADLIEMPEETAVENEIDIRQLHNALNEVISTLSEREATVLRLRFALDGGSPKTLDETGDYLGVTRERVRQIEAKALRKLRHPSRSKKLKGFLDP